MSTKRLFFALWPDNRQRDRLRDVVNSVVKTVEGKAVDRRAWHITLPYVGEFDEARIPALQELARHIPVEPFSLGFDRLEFWARSKSACLVTATVPTELQSLVDELNLVLKEYDIEPERRTYRPHMTVVSDARTFITERLVRRATTEWSSFELVESVRGPGGRSYVPIKW